MILGIKPAVKSNRINLFVDGEFAFSVNACVIEDCGVLDGDEIDDAALEKLREKEEYAAAYEKALCYLDYRDHSEKQLYFKLTRKFGKEPSAAAVEKLKELGLVDDREFAKKYADYICRNKNFGKARIVDELCAKGIDRRLASKTVEELDFDTQEALKRETEKLEIDFSDRKSVAKAYRKLYAKGFRGFSLGDFYEES